MLYERFSECCLADGMLNCSPHRDGFLCGGAPGLSGVPQAGLDTFSSCGPPPFLLRLHPCGPPPCLVVGSRTVRAAQTHLSPALSTRALYQGILCFRAVPRHFQHVLDFLASRTVRAGPHQSDLHCFSYAAVVVPIFSTNYYSIWRPQLPMLLDCPGCILPMHQMLTA